MRPRDRASFEKLYLKKVVVDLSDAPELADLPVEERNSQILVPDDRGAAEQPPDITTQADTILALLPPEEGATFTAWLKLTGLRKSSAGWIAAVRRRS